VRTNAFTSRIANLRASSSENKEDRDFISGFASVNTGKTLGWQETMKTSRHPTTYRRRGIRIELGISMVKTGAKLLIVNYYSEFSAPFESFFPVL